MILPIQALRAAAAFAIAVLHGGHEASLFAATTGRAFSPPAFLPWGAGVDVFFVISGFVMVVSSARLFDRPGAARVFVGRRIARIVPLYWLVTAAYLGLALAAPSALNSALLDPAFVAASFVFVPTARPDGLVQPLYSLGWTLNYEMFFYGLFAAAIALPIRAAVAALVLSLASLAAIGAVGRFPEPFGTWTSPLLLEFAVGIVLGAWRTDGVTISRPARIVLGVAAILLLLAVSGGGEQQGWMRAVVWGVPAACLVAACGLGAEDPWRAETRVDRTAAALGDASYALYLVHPFALRGLRAALRAAGLAPFVGPWPFLLLGLAGSVAVALAVHRFVERPLTRRLRSMLAPAPAPTGGAAPPRPPPPTGTR